MVRQFPCIAAFPQLAVAASPRSPVAPKSESSSLEEVAIATQVSLIGAPKFSMAAATTVAVVPHTAEEEPIHAETAVVVTPDDVPAALVVDIYVAAAEKDH